MTDAIHPWTAADRAYQLHHDNCEQCRAAGGKLENPDRCRPGSALWQAYNNAGDPPHFLWLRDRQRMMARRR